MLILLVLSIYAPSTQNGFIWDDDAYVGNAPEFYSQGFSNGLKKIWLDPLSTPQYYPLVHTSYLVEHSIWGQNPIGYHIVNVLLHALVALLLWQILCVLKVPWAFVIALIFALHPVQVESVAWITERKNVLSGAFYMSSLLVFIKWHATQYREPSNGSSNALYVFSIALFICALASKTVTATLPFVIMLLLWWKQTLNKKVVVRLLPFIFLGVVMGSVTAWIEQGHAGAIGEPWDLTLIERGLIAGKAVWFYIYKLLLPIDLTFIYPRWPIDSSDVFQYAYPLVLFLLIVGFWVGRKRIGRGPLAALLIFCGTLFPALGFLNVFPMQFSFVADHFQYLASAAMLTLVVGIIHHFFSRMDSRLLVSLLVVLLASYGLNVWKLQAQYKDQTTLWETTIKRNPEAWIAHGNLGVIHMNAQRSSQAHAALTKAVELNPKYIIAFNNLATLSLNLARQEKDPDRVEQYLNDGLKYGSRAIELNIEERQFFHSKQMKPKVAKEHVNSHRIVGDIYQRQNNLPAAQFHYQAILLLSPSNAQAFVRLGAIELEQKNYTTATKKLSKALQLQPKMFDALYNLGIAQYQLGRLEQASESLKKSLNYRLDNNFVRPHYYLGLIAEQKGHLSQAKSHYEIVALKMPDQTLGRKALNRMLDIALD